MLQWLDKSRFGLTIFLAAVVFVVTTSVINVFHSNADVSDQYYTLITPPGWAFSIWGLIYATELISGVLATFISRARRVANRIFTIASVGLWVATVLAQVLWSILFHFNVVGAAVPLIASVLTLWAQQSLVMRRIAEIPMDEMSEPKRMLLYLAFVAPFSLHAGWTTAAAVLNVNIIAVYGSASASAQVGTAVCSLLFVFGFAWTIGIFGTWLSGNRTDPAWTAGAAWALFAIAEHVRARPDRANGNVLILDPESPILLGLAIAARFAGGILVGAQVVRFATSAVMITRDGTWTLHEAQRRAAADDIDAAAGIVDIEHAPTFGAQRRGDASPNRSRSIHMEVGSSD